MIKNIWTALKEIVFSNITIIFKLDRDEIILSYDEKLC